MTFKQLLDFCKSQATISYYNYDTKSNYMKDYRTRDRQRKALLKAYEAKIALFSVLPDGKSQNERFIVQSGKMQYIPCQYAAVEVYNDALNYLQTHC